MANFEIFAAKILALEGGFSDHPADRGGATNMGVTLATIFTGTGEGGWRNLRMTNDK